MALLATSAVGLQRQLDLLQAYCPRWGLAVRTVKAKAQLSGERSQQAAQQTAEKAQMQWEGQPPRGSAHTSVSALPSAQPPTSWAQRRQHVQSQPMQPCTTAVHDAQHWALRQPLHSCGYSAHWLTRYSRMVQKCGGGSWRLKKWAATVSQDAQLDGSTSASCATCWTCGREPPTRYRHRWCSQDQVNGCWGAVAVAGSPAVEPCIGSPA